MESTLNETLVMFVHTVSCFYGGEIVLLRCDACNLYTYVEHSKLPCALVLSTLNPFPCPGCNKCQCNASQFTSQ